MLFLIILWYKRIKEPLISIGFRHKTTQWLICRVCKGDNLDVVKLMIQYGANHWNWGLGAARLYGHQNVVQLLIQYGANEI
jgi:hypothetical protein